MLRKRTLYSENASTGRTVTIGRFVLNVGKKMKSKFIYLVPESTIKELGIIVKYVKQVITYNSLEGGDLTTYLEVWLWIIQPFQLC